MADEPCDYSLLWRRLAGSRRTARSLVQAGGAPLHPVSRVGFRGDGPGLQSHLSLCLRRSSIRRTWIHATLPSRCQHFLPVEPDRLLRPRGLACVPCMETDGLGTRRRGDLGGHRVCLCWGSLRDRRLGGSDPRWRVRSIGVVRTWASGDRSARREPRSNPQEDSSPANVTSCVHNARRYT